MNGGTFILDTDASSDAIGAVLSQIQDGNEEWSPMEAVQCQRGKENTVLLAKILTLVFFVKQFKHY